MADDCQELALAVLAIQQEINDYSEELKFASTGQKPFLAGQIKKLNKELSEQRQALLKCLGISEPRPPLPITFTGTSTLTTSDARFPGPFTNTGVVINATFNSDRTALRIDSMAPILTDPIATPIGSDTITVSLIKSRGGTGTFDANTGHLVILVALKFDHSLPDLFVGDSEVDVTLRTDSGAGSPLSRADGTITLVGSSRFVGGFLDGTGCSLVLSGTISPLPF